jgi:hypothetical protein
VDRDGPGYHPLLELRSAVAELVFWIREWSRPRPDVITQALWLIALDGVPNSGIRRGTSARVLRLMRDVVRETMTPDEALSQLNDWEIHP